MAAAGYKVRGITIEINADTAGIIDGMKDLNSSLNSTNRALRDTEKLLKLDPENVTLLSQKQEYLTKAIEDTSAKLQQEKELLSSLQNADNADQTTEQQKALERQIEETSIKLEKYKTDLEQAGNALNGVEKETNEAEGSTKKFSSAIEDLARLEILNRVSDNAKEVAASLLECAEASAKFETSMAKIETIAQAGDGLGAMSKEIKTNAQEIGVAATSLAEATYQAISAGVETSKSIEFASQSTKLAVGGFTEAATAVDIVTTAINAYNLETEDATHIMDNLITTQNLGKTTVDELAATMGKVIPTASAYSVNIDNISAAYAELTAKGIKTKFATTELNAMLSELGDSGSDVNGILMDLSGNTFGQLMESGKSLGDVMGMLWEAAGRDKEAFYGLWSQSTAATAAFNIASDGGEKFNQVLGEMQNNAGALEAAFETMSNTSEMLDQRFQATTDNFKMAIGDALIPILDNVKEFGMEALEPMTEFLEKHPEVVQAIAGMVAGIVGVTTALTAAAAAVALFNLASGNIVAIASVLGAGAFLGGIAGLTLGMEESATSAAKLNAELNKTVETLNSNSDSYRESAAKAGELGQKIKELNGIENLNAGQKMELKAAVEQWNEAMGESNKLIIDETGHIEGNTDAIADNIEMAAREYEISLKQEELAELTKAYAEAKEALAEANERVAEAEEKAASGMEATSDQALLAQYSVESETLARDRLQETLTELEGRYNSLTEEINGNTSASEDNNGVLEETNQLTAKQKAELEELEKSYESAVESARSSLEGQREAFEEFNEGASKSVEDIAKSLEDQAKGMQEYAELIASAYEIMQERGDASGILEYYISQGPSAAGELKNLVDAFEEGGNSLATFNEAVAAFNETESLLETISGMQGAIETGFLEPMEGLVESLGENFELINEAFSENYTTQLESAEEQKTAMSEAQTGTVTGMTQAVTDNAPALAAAHKQMMEDCIKEAKTALGYDEATGRSTKFYELGMKIDQSVADGITDNMGVVAAALQACVDNAINSLDFSAISGKINAALGAAFG